jgi:hypothetical protein
MMLRQPSASTLKNRLTNAAKTGALAVVMLVACVSARTQDLRDPRFVERPPAGFSDILNLD